MIALDTNLLARLLLKDDAAQHARVKALLATDQVFTAPVTVFLEPVWVLEANDCPTANVSRGLELLLGLPNFKSGQADALHQALHAYAHGMDFADALHLALSQGEEAAMTFDKAFARQAIRLALTMWVNDSLSQRHTRDNTCRPRRCSLNVRTSTLLTQNSRPDPGQPRTAPKPRRHRSVQATAQFSTTRPWIRVNSPTLLVTSVAPSARA